MVKQSTKTDFSLLRIGDRVWSAQHGWGEVVEIDTEEGFPIAVDFEDDNETFTMDGKEWTGDKYPSIFWAEFQIPVEATNPPEDIKRLRGLPKGYVLIERRDDEVHFIGQGAFPTVFDSLSEANVEAVRLRLQGRNIHQPIWFAFNKEDR